MAISMRRKVTMRKEAVLPAEGFTHGSKFHADDVFATALLRILKPEIHIIRGLEVPENFKGIVYDIGRGRFDHHQEGKEFRDNGVPYAAFGLLWREYGDCILCEEEAQRFDEKFIQPLDESDNTGSYHVLAEAVGDFNPGWDDDCDREVCFWEAVDFAQKILENYFYQIQGAERARDVVVRAMEEGDGKVLVLPCYAPWKSSVVGSGYQFVVYPSNRGGYSVQGVPVSRDDTALVRDMPVQWRGRPAEELAKISGIATFRFCHPSGFLAAADTLEDALAIAELALQ